MTLDGFTEWVNEQMVDRQQVKHKHQHHAQQGINGGVYDRSVFQTVDAIY